MKHALWKDTCKCAIIKTTMTKIKTVMTKIVTVMTKIVTAMTKIVTAMAKIVRAMTKNETCSWENTRNVQKSKWQ